MDDTYTIDSDSDDSPVYVAKDPKEDKDFEQKRKLLWNCKGKVGKISEHRQPLTIAVIGPPGAGKSSFLNTVFAALSNDHWEEYAKYGDFGEKDRQITIRFKSFKKRDYYKEKDDYLMPTFLDMNGFEDDSSPLNKELLNIVMCGKLKEGEKLLEIIDQGKNLGVRAVHEKYFGEKYFGIIPKMDGNVPFLSRILDFVAIPNREDYHRVNKIIVVCSANPDQPLPVSLFDSITDVTTRERDITLYGVLTHADRHKSRDGRVAAKEKAFMRALGIPKTRFARIKNYCPDIDPFLTYEDTIIPSLDVSVLRLMRKVFTEEPDDTDTTVEANLKKKVSKYVPNLSNPLYVIVFLVISLLISVCFF